MKTGRTSEYPIDPLFLERWSPRAFDATPMPHFDVLSLPVFDVGTFHRSSGCTTAISRKVPGGPEACD